MPHYTATAAQTGVQPKALRVGLSGVKSTFSLPAAPSLSPSVTVAMIKVPAHAKVMFLEYWMDVAGQFTLQVGDSVNGERYRSTSTYSSGVGTVEPNVVQKSYSYSADDTIVMKVSLVSVQTLGGGIHMNVIFSMDA
jgi:hypothetical protein